MRLIIKDDADAVAQWVATYVAARINDFKPSATRPFVLGLPTGSSPLMTYKKVSRAKIAIYPASCFMLACSCWAPL